eukprot:gnl/TRDRNA2_/TRDRNA2_80551_c0_seq1.p1 gnl/TRDRNA2_/TRDRNA2_80551_c0~~gnl/TRDRNA2_/TRDRNA2_80551_c0_seq1.p1  ORF type:complete len:400 (-),score=46.40 gnl/TRDRNA2_/TRDRNA2_80551_c0_seq1:47-1246(-)
MSMMPSQIAVTRSVTLMCLVVLALPSNTKTFAEWNLWTRWKQAALRRVSLKASTASAFLGQKARRLAAEGPTASSVTPSEEAAASAAMHTLQNGTLDTDEVSRTDTELPVGKQQEREADSDPPRNKPVQNQACSKYAAEVQAWAERVVVGLGMCPWAVKAQRGGLLRYVTCEGKKPSDVRRLISIEADNLTKKHTLPLTSTLVVCPHVAAWKDFVAFDEWVERFASWETRNHGEKVALVAFHPKFLAISDKNVFTEDFEVGTLVMSHYWHHRKSGGQKKRKSVDMLPATITDTSSLGARKVRLRLHKRNKTDDGAEQEDEDVQDVHIDWLAQHPDAPLPHSLIHASPHPTVHLIRFADLEAASTPSKEDAMIHRIRSQNARRVRELGWEFFRKLAHEPK